MSDARARLNTHPMKTLNGLILGIKKGLPLELSLKKKRYTKKELVDHLVMLGNKKLIDLSKIKALPKSKSAAAAGIKAGDKLPYKKKAKPAKGKEVAAAGIKAGEKVAFKKKAKPAKGKEVAAAGIKAGEKVAFKKKAKAASKPKVPLSAKIKKEIKSILNKHYGEIAKLEQKVLDGKITESKYDDKDAELNEKLDDDLYYLKEKYNIKNMNNDTEFFKNMEGTSQKYINVLKEKSFGGFKSIPNYVKANKIGDKEKKLASKPAKGKEVAAAGIKAGEKVAFKKKTHKMPDGTVMSGATHTADSKPVKAKGKRKAKPVDELTLHKKQVKNDIKVLKSFLKKKIRPTRKNLMKAEDSVDGKMDIHQLDLESALAQMGGSKLSMSAVFKETEELVKEQTELYSKYEKKIDELRKEVEKKEAAKPVKLSKEVKELMNQKPYESAEEKKKRVKARQDKIRKKIKSRIANARSDAIKEQEKKIRSQQEGITKGLGTVKFKRKPKKV